MWYKSCLDIRMDYSKINIFNILQTKMRYLGQRQGVLAENIANADTPGYKPKDIEKLEFKDFLTNDSSHLSLQVTSPQHMGGGSNASVNGFRSDVQYKTYETSPTNNSSVIEEQMMKISQTAADYQMSTSLYAKMSNMFKLVLGNKT